MTDRPTSGPGPRDARSGSALQGWFQHVRHCLGWRLVLWLALSLSVLLGASAWLSLRLHREQLQEQLEERAIELGETMLASMHFAMLENDRRFLEQLVDDIARGERVQALRIIGTGGEVGFSSIEGEDGKLMDVSAPSCAFCHADEVVRAPLSVRDGLHLYPDPEGNRTLGLVVPIMNARECWDASCHVHGEDESLLGVLDIELSTAGIDSAIRQERRQALLLHGTTLLLLCALAGLVAWRVVHIPFHQLLEGTRRFGAGDLGHRLPERHVGELGQLAASFNTMAGRLGRARTELEEWNENLEQKVQEKTRELRRAQETMVFTEKMVSLGRLAAIVAHEINNPLAGILVTVKLVRRRLARLIPDEAERAKTDESLAMVERETARSGDIVRNLLLFSRQHALSMAPHEMPEIVERAIKLVHHQADLQQITVEKRFESDLPTVVCDGNQVEQAVLAVIMNAIDAMHDGGVLRVEVVRIDGEHVEVRVIDTGIGIPENIRAKIFEPFFTTKTEGQGTGLGLSVMYGIVQRHGGRVHVESEEGHGTTVHIVLPLVPPEGADALPDPQHTEWETLWKDVSR